jgi:hypothetical protein
MVAMYVFWADCGNALVEDWEGGKVLLLRVLEMAEKDLRLLAHHGRIRGEVGIGLDWIGRHSGLDDMMIRPRLCMGRMNYTTLNETHDTHSLPSLSSLLLR